MVGNLGTIKNQDWFTIEQIDKDTFAISEYKHWEETHCYLLCGSREALLIDTGLGVSDIGEIVKQITSLPILTVLTHAHWDHIGGLDSYSKFAIHEEEKLWISDSFPIPLQVIKNNLVLQPCEFPQTFSVDDYVVFQGSPNRILYDKDEINLGNRTIVVVHTPGHSPGHCCYYEPERKYLYSGDLIYQGKLDAFYPSTDPEKFWHSIEKVRMLDVKKLLPGHYKMPINPDIIDKIADAFQSLNDAHKLLQGSGIFDFGEFQIHI
jgi:glyoxylase-like metal-dependent hydrolase (beta-lactamase superfamily II)